MKNVFKTIIFVFYISISSSALAKSGTEITQAMRLYQQKNYSQALESFIEICKSEPSATVYCYAANCHYVLGQKQEAIGLYWYVVKNFPLAKESYTCRAFLKQIDPDYVKKSNSRNSVELPKEISGAVSSSTSSTAKIKSIALNTDGIIKAIKAEGNRPDVPADLLKQITTALNAYPPTLIKLLQQHGSKIIVTPSMIDLDPGLQNTQPRGYEFGTTYKNCPGCFKHPDIIICAYAYKGSGEEWEATNDPIGTLKHELGHAFDSFMGMISQQEEFRHAYYLDSAQVEDESKTELAYFLQKDRGGPSEAFAELFSCKYGGSPVHKEHADLVHKSFPQSAAIINKAVASLK